MKTCVCGDNQYGRIKVYFTQWGPVHIVSCKKCGLARDIKEHSYEPLYSAEAGIYTQPTDSQFQEQVTRMGAYLNFIDSHIKTKGRVLDIGCNAGFFLKALEQDGWLPTGIEINPLLAKFAVSKGLNVINRPLEESSLLEGSFDLIVISHVLEHIPGLKEFLNQVFCLLRRGGYLSIVAPNYGSYVIRAVFGGRWSGFIPRQHIWYLTKKTLKSTCESFGFRLVDCRTITNMTPASKIPFGSLVKQMLIWWMKYKDVGDELMGLFRKPL